MSYIDDVLSEKDEPTEFDAIMVDHQANGVPTESWRSLTNVGLSITHYVAEFGSTAWNIGRRIFRSMFVDTLRADLADTTLTDEEAQQVSDAAEEFVLSQYQLAAQPATIALLRVYIFSISSTVTHRMAAGDVIVGTPSQSPKLYTLTEDITLDPAGRVVALCRAEAAGSAYNLSTDAAFELKTTLVGATAALPSTGARLTVGTGNSSLALHAGTNPDEAGREVCFQIVVDGANDSTINVTQANVGDQTIVTVHSRSDGASAPLSTASEIRAALINFNVAANVLRGIQLPEGTDGSGVMALVGPVALPRADGPMDSAGQDRQRAVLLVDEAVAQWDGLNVGSGTDDALYYYGTRAPAGYEQTPVAQIQVLNCTKSDGTTKGGWVTVLLSGSFGPLTSQQLLDVTALFYSPRKFAHFVRLSVQNAATKTITVTAAVEYLRSSKLEDADVLAGIQAAFLLLQQRQLMGAQTLDPDLVKATIFAGSTAIRDVTMSLPSGDTAVAWNERPAFNVTGMTFTKVDP